MNKKTMAILIALIFVLGAVIGVWASAGDEDDPLVTKSYVDQKIQNAMGGAGGSVGYTVVHINSGQKIIGGEGTEIILRAGEASVVAQGSNGVSDITGGKDLSNGTTVTQNHLLLTPRDDGRGVKAKTEAYFMVRGVYSIN